MDLAEASIDGIRVPDADAIAALRTELRPYVKTTPLLEPKSASAWSMSRHVPGKKMPVARSTWDMPRTCTTSSLSR